MAVKVNLRSEIGRFSLTERVGGQGTLDISARGIGRPQPSRGLSPHYPKDFDCEHFSPPEAESPLAGAGAKKSGNTPLPKPRT